MDKINASNKSWLQKLAFHIKVFSFPEALPLPWRIGPIVYQYVLPALFFLIGGVYFLWIGFSNQAYPFTDLGVIIAGIICLLIGIILSFTAWRLVLFGLTEK